MPDRVCDTCHVPKPDICYEHAGSRAKRPFHVGTCSSCFRTLRAPGDARFWHSEKGAAARKRSRAAQIKRDSDGYAARVAESIARRGA